jgi:diguanylate cyclase (GGDEF)-like protein
VDPIQQEKICRLEQTIQELHARNLDRDLLGEVIANLLACRTSPEAYQVLAHYAPRLFPEVPGALYLRGDAAQATFERAMVWGGLKNRRRSFTQEQCRALWHMKPHQMECGSSNGLTCQHVGPAHHGGCLCVPLLTDGGALGVLHLASDGQALTPWKRKVAEDLGNHLAMVLASLRLREMLSEQAVRDPLTGLFNRRYMEETLRRELAVRTHRPIGIVMIDIDHFKKFNSKFTHGGGDALLRAFGGLLQKHIRPGDVACRYGGEEFILILPGASLEVAEHRAEKLRKEVKQLKVSFQDRPLGRITLSLGVAVSSPDSQAESVLQGAVQALRQAKEEGRDRVVSASAVRRRLRADCKHRTRKKARPTITAA